MPNSSLGILQVFADAGCGFDIVSGGELERVLAVGAPARDIIFSGVGKTRAEMARALDVGIGCFNVESEAELEVLSEVARAHGRTVARLGARGVAGGGGERGGGGPPRSRARQPQSILGFQGSRSPLAFVFHSQACRA